MQFYLPILFSKTFDFFIFIFVSVVNGINIVHFVNKDMILDWTLLKNYIEQSMSHEYIHYVKQAYFFVFTLFIIQLCIILLKLLFYTSSQFHFLHQSNIDAR